MQVQKDEVKNKILEAALEEFLVSGYKLSSMRNIAQQAGITVGNIYSYFSCKDDLFENVLEETVLQLRRLIDMDVSKESLASSTGIAYITGRVLEVFVQNRAQFLILMNGGADSSRYENMKAELIELIKLRVIAENAASSRKTPDTLLADSLAVAILEGICNIFNKYGGDSSRLEKLLSEFLYLVVGDIYSRM